MDKAYYGTAHYGNARYGVYYTLWDDVLAELENTDVSTFYDDILTALAEVIDSTTFNVTRYALSLGAHDSRDSWRGWRTRSYSTSTIDVPIIPRGATKLASIAGIYPILDAAGMTADVVAVGDRIKDSNNVYWDVEIVKPVYWGDSLVYRECHMTKSSMYEADFGTVTWSKTRASDSRYRTKVWMDARLRAAQLTKDNDSDTVDFAVIFNQSDAFIEREFRHSTTPVQLLYVIDEPNDTPLRSGDQIIRNYEAHVPIHIMTINSTGCSGDALKHKALAELQYICENYSTGSQRNLSERRKLDRDLGGMQLFDTVYELSYVRSAST